MKTTHISLLLLFVLCCSLNSFASEKLRLKLEEGQKISILYQFHKKTDYRPGNSGMIYEIRDQWYLNVQVIRSVSEEKFVLEVTPSRYIFDNFANRKPDIHFDSMFPPDSTGSSILKFPRLFYDALNSLNIKMGIDLNKNDLALLDNEILKNEITHFLSSQGLTQDEINNTRKQLISKIDELRKITEDYLLYFNNATFQTKDSVQINQSDFLVKRTEKQLRLSQKYTAKNKGLTEEHTNEAVIDPNNGLPLESVFKIVQPFVKNENSQSNERKEHSETFILLKNSKTFLGQVTITGYIEKPESKHVQFRSRILSLGVLQSYALVEKATYRANLDENNKFSITIPMQREGFIAMTNLGDERMVMNAKPTLIYVEPGDHIDFDLLGEAGKQTIHYKGDRSAENNCFVAQKSSTIISTPYLTFGVGVPVFTTAKAKNYNSLSDYVNFTETDEWEGVIENSRMSLKFRNYFLNEVMMSKLQIACNILTYFQFYINEKLTPELKQAETKLQNFVDQFQICRYYNENGFFDPAAVSAYADLLFKENIRYADPLAPENDFSLNFLRSSALNRNPKQQEGFLKMILAGSPLFHQEFSILHRNLTSSNRFSKYSKTVWFELQKELAEDILASSHDSALNRQVENEMERAAEIHNGKVYYKKLFLTPQGDTVSIADYLGKKPCVIFPARNWGQNRYLFDDIAKKYPNVNAILINEGKDFNQWKGYLKRARPVSVQLFLDNKNGNLNQLFMGYNGFNSVIVFDKNGHLLDYEADINQIERYLKKAMNPPPVEKKELNKSTLYGIIWFLGGSLLLGLIAFLIFKARMRLKLRKENREKRLQELQLSAIRAQMNPHFLFNSLNSVQNLIQKNQGREAHLYLSDFAGLIRKVLKNSQSEEVSLAEELETLNQYIRLEQLRFDFEYEQIIDDQIDQNHFMVPSLILQPVAENAIMHGLQHKPDNRKLNVEIKKLNKAIQISIEDNGIGIDASKKIKSVSNDIGLNMNEERLRIMQEKYGGNYSFKLIDLTKKEKAGTRVEITIPEEE